MEYLEKAGRYFWGANSTIRRAIHWMVAAVFFINTISFPPDTAHAYEPDSHDLQVQSIFKPIISSPDVEYENQLRIETAIILASIIRKFSEACEKSKDSAYINAQLPSLSEINAELDKWFTTIKRDRPSSDRARILRIVSDPRAIYDPRETVFMTTVDVEVLWGENRGKKFRFNSYYNSINEMQSDESKLSIEPVPVQESIRRAENGYFQSELPFPEPVSYEPLDVEVKVESGEARRVMKPSEEKYILNAGVLSGKYLKGLSDTKRLIFARRVTGKTPIPEIPAMLDSRIGLYVHDVETDSMIEIDRDLLAPENSALLSLDPQVKFLEDARVLEYRGRIYVYLTAVREVERNGEKEVEWYSAVTSHDRKALLGNVAKKLKGEEFSWEWTPLKKLINDGPCAGQNIKNFAPFNAPYRDEKGRRVWYALYRPEERWNSTIRLACSYKGPDGPWQDMREYKSVNYPDIGWIGPSASVHGARSIPECPFEVVFYHRGAEYGPKYYDVRAFIIDKRRPSRFTEAVVFAPEDRQYDIDGWIKGVVYTTGAVLKDYQYLPETGEHVLDIDVYYAREDTDVWMRPVRMVVRDKKGALESLEKKPVLSTKRAVPSVGEEGDRWKADGIKGPFTVNGKNYFVSEINGYEAMTKAINKWFEGVGEGGRDFDKEQLMISIAPAEEDEGSRFLVRMMDESGRMIGLTVCGRSPIMVMDEDLRGVYEGYLGDYLEIESGYRGMGLGKILLAKSVESIMTRLGYVDILNGGEESRTMFEIMDIDKPIMVVHPADSDAERFFRRGDIRFRKIDDPQVEYIDSKDDRNYNLFYVISWGDAMDLVDEVRGMNGQDISPQMLLPIPGYPAPAYSTVPQIGKQYDVENIIIGEGKDGPDSIGVMVSEKDSVFTEKFVLHVTDKSPPVNKRAIVENAIDNKDLVGAMMNAFPDDVRVVFYAELYGDMFGLAHPGGSIIAINKELYPDRFMAVIHEIGEYLVSSGKLALRFDKASEELYATVDGVQFGPIDVSDAMDDLRDNGEVWLENDQYWFDREKNQHYLLRILQRRVFEDIDRRLTRSIRSISAEKAYDAMIYPLIAKGARRFSALDAEVREILIWAGVDEDLVELTNAMGDGAGHFFEYSLKGVRRFGAGFIAAHWAEMLNAGVQAEDNAWRLFQEGFPGSIGIEIIKEHWEEIQDICARAGRNSCYVLSDGLPIFYSLDSGFLDEIYSSQDPQKRAVYLARISDVLIRIAEKAGDGTQGLFTIGDAATRHAYGPDRFETGLICAFNAARVEGDLDATLERFERRAMDMLNMGKAAGDSRSAGDIYSRGMSALKRAFGEDFIKEYWEEIMVIGGSLEHGVAVPVLESTLPAIGYMIVEKGDPVRTRENLVSFGKDIIRMAAAAYGDPDGAHMLFDRGIPGMLRAFGEESVREHWQAVVETAVIAGERSGYVLSKGLPMFADDLRANSSMAFEVDLIEIGKGLSEFSEADTELIPYMYQVLPFFMDQITSRDAPGYIRLRLRALGKQLSALGADAGTAKKELFAGIENLFSVYGRWSVYRAWPALNRTLLSICGNSTDYNRPKILGLILGRGCLEALKERGADLVDHMDFYNTIIKERRSLAFNVLEGVTEGMASGMLPAVMSTEDKNAVLRFSGRMNGFSPLLYKMYHEKGEQVLETLAGFAEDVSIDAVGKAEIDAFLTSDMFAGYDMPQREEMLLAAVQMRIPLSGASFVKKGEVLSLLSRRIYSGDRRNDVPEPLRNRDFGDGEEDAIPIVQWRLRKGEKVDPDNKIRDMLSVLRASAEEDEAAARYRDREKFLAALEAFFSSGGDASKQEECLRALCLFASHDEVIRQKVNAVEGASYYDLLLIEQIFSDKDNLGAILKKELKEIDQDKLPRQKLLEGRKLSDPNAVKRTVTGIWMSRQADEARRASLSNVLTGLDANEVEDKLISIIEIPELKGLIRDIMLSRPTFRAMAHKDIIEELLSGTVEMISREREKFDEISDERSSVLEFRVVKGMPHGLWGLNAGVCVAQDDSLWESDKFFLLEMYDTRNRRVAGYVHLVEAEVGGEKVLTVPGIEPSTEYLSEVKAREVYPLIEKALLRIKEAGGYMHLCLPTLDNEGNITSNRSDIVKVVSGRYGEPVVLPDKIYWNSTPSPYPFDIVWEITAPVENAAASEAPIAEGEDADKRPAAPPRGEKREEKDADVPAQGLSALWEYEEIPRVKPLSGVDRRVVVVGDIHGDLDAFRNILENTGVIKRGDDPDGKEDIWTGGDACLIQGGDVVDRGEKSIEAFKYLRMLQVKANTASGQVVRLIGNHELFYLYKHARGRWKGQAERLRREDMIRGFNEALWHNDRELVGMIREDIRNGNLIGAYSLGGKVFTHGVILPGLVDAFQAEYVGDISDPDTFSYAVNDTLRDSARSNRFDSVIFSSAPGIINDNIWGIADYYFSKVSLLAMDWMPFDEVVFHDPHPFQEEGRLGVITDSDGEKSIVDVDVGMTTSYGSGRAALVFQEGRVLGAYPKLGREYTAPNVGSGLLRLVKQANEERHKQYVENLKDKLEYLNKESLSLYRAVVKGMQDIAKSAEEGETLPPVDIVIDVSLVSKIEEDVDANAETLAYLIMLCGCMKNVNFIFTRGMRTKEGLGMEELPYDVKRLMDSSPDPGEFMDKVIKTIREGSFLFVDDDIRAGLLGEGLPEGEPGRVRVKGEKEKMGSPEGIEVPITSTYMLEWIRDEEMELLDNQYPVALEGPNSAASSQVNLNNFESAFMIGLAKAVLVAAERRVREGEKGASEDLAEIRPHIVSKLKSLYLEARGEDKLTDEIVGYLISQDGVQRLNRALEWFLPPVGMVNINALTELHEHIQEFLKAA
ncbi:MAG: metallophosphoesterase [Candidatus Omnitrophica bacterium]|nr:metallophosphoesterase [Candidatus Omnitrophota bacterium]MDD5487415.1 metallophosphoesterase [Candidatus Omnitrophota bacterium]